MPPSPELVEEELEEEELLEEDEELDEEEEDVELELEDEVEEEVELEVDEVEVLEDEAVLDAGSRFMFSSQPLRLPPKRANPTNNIARARLKRDMRTLRTRVITPQKLAVIRTVVK